MNNITSEVPKFTKKDICSFLEWLENNYYSDVNGNLSRIRGDRSHTHPIVVNQWLRDMQSISKKENYYKQFNLD